MSAPAPKAAVSTMKQAPPPLRLPASLKPNPTPVAPAFESLPVDKSQCEKAIKALIAHVETIQKRRDEEDLLGESDEKVFLVVGLKRPAKREVHMPIRLPLVHPVIDPRISPVTLFVKDPQRTYKDLLEASKISFIARVVGLDKLRTKHKTFEAKRLLLKEADMFLVDDRVVVDVGKSLGKAWRDAKKQPVPVAINRKDLKAELERAVSSTYLQINTGSSLSIKFGTTSLHSTSQLHDNLLSLIPQLAVRLPNGGWSNVQSLHIKTSTSIALPIYNTTLDDAGIFSGPTAEDLAGQQRALEAKAAKQAERDEKLRLKEVRRLERSATASGKGREEKKAGKRKAADMDDVVVDLPLTAPIVADDDAATTTTEEVAEKPVKAKKSKKAAKDVVVVEEEPVVAEVEETRPAKKTRSSSDASSKKAAKGDGEAKVVKTKRSKA